MKKGHDLTAAAMPFGRGYGYGYGYASSHASTYTGRRAGSTAGSRDGNLPDIALGPPRRHRPPSGLQLMGTAAPNMGAHPHVPMTPRERERSVHYTSRLSSSDPKGLESLRPIRRHDRHHTTDDRMLPRGDKPQYSSLGGASRPSTVMPLPQRPPSSFPYRTLPPIFSDVPSSSEVDPTKEEDSGSGKESETESSLGESEEEIISDEDSDVDAPPSRPGFESDAEQSAQQFEIPFPPVAATSAPFPATLIQDNAQLDQERFSASAHPSGLSARVENVVRAFQIHGPLDRELLSRALNEVASLHPLLTATFQRTRDKLYIQTSHGKVSVNLESPVVGYETPQNLVINARRKLFPLTMRNTLVASEEEEEWERKLSVVSLGGHHDDPLDKTHVQHSKKSVSFAKPALVPESSKGLIPPLPTPNQSDAMSGGAPLLMRARLVSKKHQEYILVLSFPRVICDFWSSCLFVQQLADAYSKLEKSSSHRPNLASLRAENKKGALISTRRRVVSQMGEVQRGRTQIPNRLQERIRMVNTKMVDDFTPSFPAQLHFQQVGQRESQLLKMMPKEKLWEFWESMVTAVIRRKRGPNRIKVVPPVRIPSGLGERVARMRPQTSRFRPLTASRNRPPTAKQQSGVFKEPTLAGAPTLFHFIKVEEEVCAAFRMALPEEHLMRIKKEEVLSLMCLGAFVLLLGKCCRGWGADERWRGEGASGSVHNIIPAIMNPKQHFTADPLQEYKTETCRRNPRTIVVPSSSLRRASRGGRLDLGSFLIGVEVSLRDCIPRETVGLFGPLTNDVAICVNLSSSETFADLVVALGKSLMSAHNHGHFPFSTVADEIGLINGLPIKFSFLHHRDVIQLTNPDQFYFTETAMGVKGHGLARFGSHCYLTPLSMKMNDSCYLELLLWEGYEAESVGGGFRYQPHVIRTELIEAFGSELCHLLVTVAANPCIPLPELASKITPPFLSSHRMRSRKLRGP